MYVLLYLMSMQNHSYKTNKYKTYKYETDPKLSKSSPNINIKNKFGQWLSKRFDICCSSYPAYCRVLFNPCIV